MVPQSVPDLVKVLDGTRDHKSGERFSLPSSFQGHSLEGHPLALFKLLPPSGLGPPLSCGPLASPALLFVFLFVLLSVSEFQTLVLLRARAWASLSSLPTFFSSESAACASV